MFGVVAVMAVLRARVSVSGVSTLLARADAAVTDIYNIRHVIVIMQDNRSFDTYFGTFPGADGIPMSNGVPTGVYAGSGESRV